MIRQRNCDDLFLKKRKTQNNPRVTGTGPLTQHWVKATCPCDPCVLCGIIAIADKLGIDATL